MKPFFCYYGAKNRAGRKYPAPCHDVVVEPFAGCAGYSVAWDAPVVHLSDVDERVCGIWEFLIASSPEDILALPSQFNHVDELNVCQEAKWLIGYWCNLGGPHPMKKPSKWMKTTTNPQSWWGDRIKQRLAAQVCNIKNWTIKNCSYENVSNITATWFIDAPYNNKAGKCYKYSQIDYDRLAEWCLSRKGQLIVCENLGADWLPFENFIDIKSSGNRSDGVKISKEVIYIQ